MIVRRILRDIPAAAVIAIASIGLGELILNDWLWFAALILVWLVAREDQQV